MTSARTPRFSPHVAILAILALCSTVAALALADNYDRSENDPAARTAVVGPSESGRPAAGKARAPQPTATARQVVNTRNTASPSVSPPPPLPDATESSLAPIPKSTVSTQDAAGRAVAPKKPEPSSSAGPVPGAPCAVEGKPARTTTGDKLVCGPSATDPRNRWHAA